MAIIAVVALVGATGWMVYKNNRKETPTATTPVTQTPTTETETETKTPPAKQANIVKIPELGVQFTVPDGLKDMAYKVSGNDLTAYLSTKALNTAEGGKCDITTASAAKGSVPPLGFLVKTTGQYPASPTSENASGTLVKQFSTYYIAHRSAGMSCFSETATIETVTGLNAQLTTALKSITEIK